MSRILVQPACDDDGAEKAGSHVGGFSRTTPDLPGGRGDRGTLSEICIVGAGAPVDVHDNATPAEGFNALDDAVLRAAASATQSGVMRRLGVSELSAQAADDFRVIMAGLTKATRRG